MAGSPSASRRVLRLPSVRREGALTGCETRAMMANKPLQPTSGGRARAHTVAWLAPLAAERHDVRRWRACECG